MAVGEGVEITGGEVRTLICECFQYTVNHKILAHCKFSENDILAKF